MGQALIAFVPLITVVLIASLLVSPFWVIFPRLGFDKRLALLMWVPLVNIIVLYVVAFSKPRIPILDR